jgi:hypothetical protein
MLAKKLGGIFPLLSRCFPAISKDIQFEELAAGSKRFVNNIADYFQYNIIYYQ